MVERSWSLADRLIDGSRNNASPMLMEALLFLRCNRQFWDEETALLAHKAAQRAMLKKANDLLEEDEMHVQEN